MSNLFGQDGRLKSQIPLKVYSSNRRTRKLLGADSYNQLIIKCREKFNLHDYEEDNIKVVLYDDGMEVDSDSFLFLDPNTSIMILQGNEIWSPPLPPLNDPQQLLSFIENLKVAKRKAVTSVSESRNSSKKSKMPQFVSVSTGWMHYDYADRKFKQVRSSTTQQLPRSDLTIPSSSSYGETLKIMENLYFHNGKNFRGRVSSMVTQLGNSHGEEIPSFTNIFEYGVRCSTQKSRIYLLTRKKIADVFCVTDSSSADEGNDPGLVASTSSSPYTVNAGRCSPTAMTPQNQMQTSWTNFNNSPQSQMDTRTPQTQTATWTDSIMHVPAGTPTVLVPVDRRCSICCDRERNAVIVPCIHTFCLECALQIEGMGQDCPQCRGTIEDVKEMFLD
ncbi:uncharacterized protein LOC143055197 [Mytilus galloprovincialis]|uniref:RING-type domain-containing protein n=1 Tax=Mytilus galloprovincialis TaxID=29158 RepID=A0A8B6C1W0_MYTGA|nr:Hypothetical predicted protein [Mytilus galloprovincialis]